MLIRKATSNDLSFILEVMNDAILNTTAIYDYNARSIDYVTTWFNKKTADGMPVLVGEVDGVLVGYGTYGIFRPWDAYQFSVEHSIYIATDKQGKGLGSKLLAALIDTAKQQGLKTMIAGIDADNAPSIQLHKKLGFETVGTFYKVGYKFDRWLDLVFMQLFL